MTKAKRVRKPKDLKLFTRRPFAGVVAYETNWPIIMAGLIFSYHDAAALHEWLGEAIKYLEQKESKK